MSNTIDISHIREILQRHDNDIKRAVLLKLKENFAHDPSFAGLTRCPYGDVMSPFVGIIAQ
ncbi:hypothetical protein THIOM_003871 [Candidatus Thiomargarita nelsonii]|uniref:Uncharacterized protein n=1 Tax=Candidatus Thiomargarita nelsonii TaxID=1003181 RepID=A0A176RXD6_9GAMM|nr:hypothetical protein THIOM_003871 [Candidatus Thiomargarita nelsonii]